MSELNGGTPPATVETSAPPVVVPAPANFQVGQTGAAPLSYQWTFNSTNADVSVPAVDTPDQAAARAALLEKLNESNPVSSPTNTEMPAAAAASQQMTPAPAIVVTGANNMATNVTTPVETPMSSPTATPSTPSSTAYEAAAQAALSASQTNVVVTGAPITSPPSKSSEQAPAANVNDSTAKQLGLNPIQAPPPPVSAQQQEQLNELLQRYEADQISPEQYQAGRAKILAGQ